MDPGEGGFEGMGFRGIDLESVNPEATDLEGSNAEAAVLSSVAAGGFAGALPRCVAESSAEVGIETPVAFGEDQDPLHVVARFGDRQPLEEAVELARRPRRAPES